ncbi:MAG: MFS transporter [Candidatus Woesearchaeota archaeon]
MIRALAVSMLAIFIPIYFFKDLNYSIQNILYFYIIVFLTIAIFSPLAGKLISRIGFKHNILLSTFFFIIAFLLLNLLKIQNSQDLFYFIPIIFGIGNALYWNSFHIDLAKYSKKGYRGEQIAAWQVLAGISAIIGPLVAGLILKFYSFNVLFIVGSFIFLISVIPLFFSKDQHIKFKFSYKYILKKEHFKEGLTFAVTGIKQVVLTILWPFFIYLIVLDYLKFGSVMTAINILALITYGTIGKLSDIKKSEILLKFGAIIHLTISLVMGFIKTIIQIIGASVFIISGIYLTELNTTKKAYETAKNSSNLAGYMVFREVVLNIGRALLTLIFLILVSIPLSIQTSFIIIFIISGLSGLIHIIRPRK